MRHLIPGEGYVLIDTPQQKEDLGPARVTDEFWSDEYGIWRRTGFPGRRFAARRTYRRKIDESELEEL